LPTKSFGKIWEKYVMVKLVEPFLEDSEYIKIGVYEGGKRPTWYARIYSVAHKETFTVSLKIPYEPGKLSAQLARKTANKYYQERFLPKVKRGQKPSASTSPITIANQYLQHIWKFTEANEKLIGKGKLPVYEVEGGRGYWDMRRYNQADYFQKEVLYQFWEYLGIDQIEAIKIGDLNKFRDWAFETFEWSPSQINKAITQIRQLWNFAYEKDLVGFIPSVKRASPNNQERSRKRLTEDEYLEIIKYTREKYLRNYGLYGECSKTDLAYQFHIWILLISNAGFRPPHGQVERLLPRWSDVVSNDNGIFIKRRDEKTPAGKSKRDYLAILNEDAWDLLDDLKTLYDKREMKPTYLFEHTFDKENGWERGKPILNFRGQWRNMTKALELDAPKGSMQKDRIVPYALRHFYIQHRVEGSEAQLIDLATATGTSPTMINEIYYVSNTEKQADKIRARRKRAKKKRTYTGIYYSGRK